MDKQCTRLNCEREAECEITLERGEEKTAYRLCMFHYLQAIQVIQGIQVVTGSPESEMGRTAVTEAKGQRDD